MQDNTEKFYDTYGKNVSFESPAVQEIPVFEAKAIPTESSSVGTKLKKFLAVFLFAVLIAGIALVGGIFLIIFLSVLLIDMIIRSIFFRSSPSSVLIIKK